MPRRPTAGALGIFRGTDGNYRGPVLVVAVLLLACAMGVLALAVRRVATSPSPSSLHGTYRSAATAAADLDGAVAEFRATVDDRADR